MFLGPRMFRNDAVGQKIGPQQLLAAIVFAVVCGGTRLPFVMLKVVEERKGEELTFNEKIFVFLFLEFYLAQL